MTNDPLKTLSDLITESHTRIQQEYADINPVVSVRRGMRDTGIPADAMTIDCLRSGKRIVLILHDQQPNTLIYQLTMIDHDSNADFRQVAFSTVTAEMLFEWVRDYFSAGQPSP